jgi:hypothetical protein
MKERIEQEVGAAGCDVLARDQQVRQPSGQDAAVVEQFEDLERKQAVTFRNCAAGWPTLSGSTTAVGWCIADGLHLRRKARVVFLAAVRECLDLENRRVRTRCRYSAEPPSNDAPQRQPGSAGKCN